MKKYIFTETQIKRVVEEVINEKTKVLNEQEIENKKMMGIQTFLNYKFYKLKLNVDGVQGPRTTEAIKKYQEHLGIVPDGLWGVETESAIRKNPTEWKLYKTCVEGKYGMVDKFLGANVR